MRLKGKVLNVLLTACIILGTSVTAYAAVEEENVGGFIVGNLETVDISEIDPSNIVEITQPEPKVLAVDGLSAELSSNIAAPDINLPDLENAKELDSMLEKNTFNSRSLSYNLASTSDVLKPGATECFYTINVNSAQILQVELQVPQNVTIDYDLYIYEPNEATSELTMVSGSQYDTDSSFMPESAGVINRSGSTIKYYIRIVARKNPSTTEYYTLNVSVGEHVEATTETPTNAFEPNESAFFAVEFPAMTSSTYVTVPGGLNTPIDNDWFSVYIEDTSEFAGLEIEGIPENVVVETYTTPNGSLLAKQGSTLNGNILPIAAGYNYFRIKFKGDGAFNPVDYSIKFTPALTATKVLVLTAVDGYCQRYSSLFNDGKSRPLYTMGSEIRIWVQYLTDNNIRTKASDTVEVTIFNPAWDNPFMQYETGSTTVKDSYDCSVYVPAPTLRSMNFETVYTTVTSQRFGTLKAKEAVVLLNKYGDAETSRPCIHNGTCGLK